MQRSSKEKFSYAAINEFSASGIALSSYRNSGSRSDDNG
jgi:hypothetical protein